MAQDWVQRLLIQTYIMCIVTFQFIFLGFITSDLREVDVCSKILIERKTFYELKFKGR